MTSANQDQINDTVWAACEAFRGDMSVRQVRDYVLVLLFLKYLSDWRVDYHNQLRAQLGDDSERIGRRLERARFVLPPVMVYDSRGEILVDRFQADLYELNIRREQVNIGELIDLSLAALEAKNRAKLDRVFHHVSFNNESLLGHTPRRNARLKPLLSCIAYLELRSQPGSLSALFLYLLERFANEEGKNAVSPHTPQAVARLLVGLTRPGTGDCIGDPVCGNASLLIEAAQHVGNDQFHLFGQEGDPGIWALARMHVYIHGLDGTRLELGDTLRNPLLLEQGELLQFDAVVAHPPSPLDQWLQGRPEQDPYGRYWRGAPPKSKADYAFISHCIEVTRPGKGRLALIAPQGVLFRGGAEGRIRQRLLADNLLDAIVVLPGNLFACTPVPLVVLLFDRSREVGGARFGVRDVLLVDASAGLGNGKARQTFSFDQVTDILQMVQQRRSQGPKVCLVSFDEIAANDFDLNLPRYLIDRKPSGDFDLVAAHDEIASMEQELLRLRTRMSQHIQSLHEERAEIA